MKAILALMATCLLLVAGSEIFVVSNTQDSRQKFSANSASYERHTMRRGGKISPNSPRAQKIKSKITQNQTSQIRRAKGAKYPPQITPNVHVFTPSGEFKEQTHFRHQGRNLQVTEQTSFSQGASTLTISQTSNYKYPPRRKKHTRRR